MSINRDDMVFTPRFKEPRDAGPRRRAVEARNTARAKRKRAALLQRLRKARVLHSLQSARSAKTTANVRKGAQAASRLGAKSGSRLMGPQAASRLGAKAGSRLMGPVGVALLMMDAINIAGSTVRRVEGGVSGRLLEAMDQDSIYGNLDELATGAARGRENIEGDEDLLRIIGSQGRVNAQIGQLGAYFKERETARAIGADLIEREPTIDHLGSVADKVIQNSAHAVKTAADSAVNSIRSFLGKEAIVR